MDAAGGALGAASAVVSVIEAPLTLKGLASGAGGAEAEGLAIHRRRLAEPLHND
jgi:hypothetical protein